MKNLQTKLINPKTLYKAMSAKGTTWKKRKPEKIPDSIMNLCESLKGEIELYQSKVKELEQRNKVLEDALQGIIDNWTERMSGDIEVWKDPSSSLSGKGYYSPSASLVSSEFIAKAREVLSNNQKSKQ